MAGMWQVDIVHLKADQMFDYIKHIPKAVELFKKYGATPIDQYITEVGASPEVIYINKFDSFEQRSKNAESWMKDPEFLTTFKDIAGAVIKDEMFLCSANPEIGVNQPKNPQSKKNFEMIKVSDPTQIGTKLKEAVAFWDQKLGANATKLLVALHPIFYTSHCNVICIFEMPDNFDSAIGEYGKALADPHNWPKLSAQAKELEVLSRRCINPISNLKLH